MKPLPVLQGLNSLEARYAQELELKREIQLTQGKVAIVDGEDYEKISKYKWNLHNAGYAHRNPLEDNLSTLMHRVVFDLKKGDKSEIDHINGNRLDNRRCNLRFVTRSKNNMNRRVTNGASGYKGVSWFKPVKKWRVYIKLNGKQKCLGYFSDKKAAAQAYNDAATKYFREYAALNKI